MTDVDKVGLWMELRLPNTLRQKLLVVILLTTFVALVIALTSTVAYNLHTYHKNLVTEVTTQAELVGHISAPALASDDRLLALQTLNQLTIWGKVRAAAIYTARGEIFATYASPGEDEPFPKLPEMDVADSNGSSLNLFKRIVSDGKILGTVYLRADDEQFKKLVDYFGISAVVMLVTMVIAFFMSAWLQTLVTGPILAIAKIAREVVEERDYTRRAENISDDEVGILVESFNDMLSEIERRTRELEDSNREIAREVDERKQAQLEIMRLNTELETRVRHRTSQLEATNQELVIARALAEKSSQAKSAFVSSMSHELRTPLNAILGFGQLLASESMHSTAEQQKKFVGYIVDAGKHLLVLINEILDLAKIESGTLSLSTEPVSLAEIMQESRVMIEPLADARNIRVIFPKDDTVKVIADRTRLKQILLNLLSNAVKYNRDNGTVIVGCTSISPELVRIIVQDTGPGLSPDKVEQLFQPFNRLGQESGTEEGTGIGLIVTKRLVELLGGRIGVTSHVGIGSVFWIELKSSPLDKLPEEARTSLPGSPENAKPANGATRRLLYVEDNPANVKLVEQIVSFRPDLRILTAADGHLGIELARTHQPEVILMDVNLPTINGNEALQILRHDFRTSHIPVIALTANAMSLDIEKSMSYGYFRYLTKPINIEDFFEALDSALRYSESVRSPSKEN